MNKKDDKVTPYNIKELLESGEAEALPHIVDGEIVGFGVVINRRNKNENSKPFT